MVENYMSDDLLDHLDFDANAGLLSNQLRLGFGYPGSKNGEHLKHILPRLPERQVYVEPCGGSGAVLLNRKPSQLDVFNDRCSGVTAFFRCLQQESTTKALADRISICVYSREEWELCKNYEGVDDIVERAARWFYTVKCSFAHVGRHFNAPTVRLSRFYPAFGEVAAGLMAIHQRFSNVLVENLDILELFKRYDGKKSVFYVDPTYLNSCDHVYRHNMSVQKHQAMLEAIMSMDGFVAVSGYENPLYNDFDWDEIHKWETVRQFKGSPVPTTEVLFIKHSN